MQNRMTSKAAWAALLGLVGLIMTSFGLYEKLGITEEAWQAICTSGLGVLVAFGVLNNPTDPSSF